MFAERQSALKHSTRKVFEENLEAPHRAKHVPNTPINKFSVWDKEMEGKRV